MVCNIHISSKYIIGKMKSNRLNLILVNILLVFFILCILLCFNVFQFLTVNSTTVWQVLFQVLKEASVYFKEKRMTLKLYEDEKAIEMFWERKEEACIKKIVRRSCAHPSRLFNQYIHRRDSMKPENTERKDLEKIDEWKCMEKWFICTDLLTILHLQHKTKKP